MDALIRTALVLVVALGGGGLVVQAGVNSQLARALGHPLWATMISLAVSTLLTAMAVVLLRAPAPGLAQIAGAPPAAWLGGFFGAAFLAIAVLIAPRLGAAGFVAAVVAGQMVTSLLLDQFALFGFAQRQISLWRFAGVALVVAGVAVLQLAPRK